VATRISLRREQVVAASLVGSVVVLLGFASGLGLHHTTSAAAAPPTTATPAPPGATDQPGGDQPGDGGYQPAGYVGTDGQQGDMPYPATTTAALPTVTTTTAAPTTTSSGTTTTTSTPTCTPGLVPQVVGVVTTGVQGLPLLGPVVSGVGLPPLVDSLLGSCPATSTTTPTATTTR
jgi:hypothetical protein